VSLYEQYIHTLDAINTRPKLLHAMQIGVVLLQNSKLKEIIAPIFCIAISNPLYSVPISYRMWVHPMHIIRSSRVPFASTDVLTTDSRVFNWCIAALLLNNFGLITQWVVCATVQVQSRKLVDPEFPIAIDQLLIGPGCEYIPLKAWSPQQMCQMRATASLNSDNLRAHRGVC
jgi:hypothetical protein